MLTEGDIFRIEPGDAFYALVPRHFTYASEKHVGDWELSRGELKANTGDWSHVYIGDYVVTKTTRDGGGTAHGPGDVYPDGHHIWAQHTQYQNLKIDFYQSGCFTCMLPNKVAIGRAQPE